MMMLEIGIGWWILWIIVMMSYLMIGEIEMVLEKVKEVLIDLCGKL